MLLDRAIDVLLHFDVIVGTTETFFVLHIYEQIFENNMKMFEILIVYVNLYLVINIILRHVLKYINIILISII